MSLSDKFKTFRQGNKERIKNLTRRVGEHIKTELSEEKKEERYEKKLAGMERKALLQEKEARLLKSSVRLAESKARLKKLNANRFGNAGNLGLGFSTQEKLAPKNRSKINPFEIDFGLGFKK